MHAVLDAALLPGPAPTGESGWVGVLPTSITADDVGLWPYSVGALVNLAAFFGHPTLACFWRRFGYWWCLLC